MKNTWVIFLFAVHVVQAADKPLRNDPGQSIGISANPGSAVINTGTGQAEQFLLDRMGIKDDHGVRIGGVWVGNTNWLMSGGAEPGKVSWNSLFIADVLIDMEKLTGWWKGGSIGGEFLQFNGEPTNQQLGSVQGYNSLPGAKPLNRSELYQLWIRQSLFDDKLVVRVGKSLPTANFGNVLKPTPLNEQQLVIPAVSGLLYTPIFINPTMDGVAPGYYNSACGVTINFAPVKWWYFDCGFYDGSMAKGVQTGMTGPNFSGYYFSIGETGFAWLLGKDKLPGNFGAGYWDQTGQLNGANGTSENGTSGFYLFGSQRLWYRHPGQDTSGISSFLQFGVNRSKTLSVNQYLGLGLTAFGLVPNRPKDSMGCGMSLGWLNQRIYQRSSELMFQTYYQANIWQSMYLETALTYIPTPGASASLGGAWASTMQLTVLF